MAQKEPPKSYRKKLDQAKTKEERVAMVRQAMADGHSNTTAAKALGTTPGTIAGIRNKAKIPSKHGAPSMGKPPPPAPPPAPPSLPPASQPREAKPTELLDRSKVPDELKPRLAGGNWMMQCVATTDGVQCGHLRIPGHDTCLIHTPELLAKYLTK